MYIYIHIVWHIYTCTYIACTYEYMYTVLYTLSKTVYIYVYMDMWWLRSVESIKLLVYLQNIVSFVGLLCKRDL